MFEHLHAIASAFNDIAAYDPHKAFVAFSIDKDLDIQPFQQFFIGEYEDAFHDDDLFWLNPGCFRAAGAGNIGISGHFDSFTFPEHIQVFHKQTPFNGVGMIEVDFLFFFRREVTVVPVVGILRNNRNGVFRQTPYNFFDDGGFSASGSSGNSDNEHTDIFIRQK